MARRNIIWLFIIIIVCALIFGAFFLYVKKHRRARGGTPFYGSKPSPAMCVHPDGIDLSHHNVAYDWKKVDAKFVYVRATFGLAKKDKRYSIHRRAARRHDIPVGAYHFLVANKSAREQFYFFASVVKRCDITLRPALDVEDSKYWRAPKGFTNRDVRKLIREWCDLCKKHYGKSPVIYITEKNYLRYGLGKGFDDCLFWVANYNNIKNYHDKSAVPFVIHQYSDKKFVEGFYGRIDCNRFSPGHSVDDLRL